MEKTSSNNWTFQSGDWSYENDYATSGTNHLWGRDQATSVRIPANSTASNVSPLLTPVKVGTPQSETIYGTSDADIILGLAGINTLNGGGGNDLLCEGNSRGTLNGGPGDDTLRGGQGNDRLEGGNHDDTLTVGLGVDFFSGGPGTDSATDFNATEGDTKDTTIP